MHTFDAKAKAYSATTVFPAEVWAATKTDSPLSRWYIACIYHEEIKMEYYAKGPLLFRYCKIDTNFQKVQDHNCFLKVTKQPHRINLGDAW